MLNSESSPTNPAATAASAANSCCSIGEATLSTPIPELTFISNTNQINQNCGVRTARLRCTWPEAAKGRVTAGRTQPSGFQSAGGTR